MPNLTHDLLDLPKAVRKGDFAPVGLWLLGGAGAAVNDVDGDGVLDAVGDCVTVASADQTDTDGDGLADACAHPSATVDVSTDLHGAYSGAWSTVGPSVGAGSRVR